ncbi:cytosolic iron-sulfur protein assembly [Polyplax serrata]|uniref:Probable cytosolic iron-sulfur protein assembly protein Ciao1 n=1 Tax=Polyplax serrata TaxID=468196 RepID=A0AAN8SCE9_POLSC
MGKLEQIQCLKAHDGRVWNVAWHPQGNYLASCGEDKTICIWAKDNFGKWQNKTKLTEGHSRTIREINWSPCGNYIASASFDSTIGIWDKKSGEWECNATLEGHENEVKSVAWASSGQLLASCSRDKSVWVWEIADEDEYECAAVLNAHTQDIKKVKWHPHIDILASVSYDNTIKIFKEDPTDHDWICSSTLTSHESTVWSLAFDKSGSRFATVSDDKTLKIWREYQSENAEIIPTPNGDSVWKNICTLSGYHTRTLYDVSWCHLTDLIVTACGDDGIRIFKESECSNENEPTFEMVCSEEKAHTQDVNSVAWNPVISGLIASCSDDGTVKLWQFKE